MAPCAWRRLTPTCQELARGALEQRRSIPGNHHPASHKDELPAPGTQAGDGHAEPRASRSGPQSRGGWSESTSGQGSASDLSLAPLVTWGPPAPSCISELLQLVCVGGWPSASKALGRISHCFLSAGDPQMTGYKGDKVSLGLLAAKWLCITEQSWIGAPGGGTPLFPPLPDGRGEVSMVLGTGLTATGHTPSLPFLLCPDHQSHPHFRAKLKAHPLQEAFRDQPCPRPPLPLLNTGCPAV